MKLTLTLLLASVAAFGAAGQSVDLAGTHAVANTSVPAQAANGICRVEFNVSAFTGKTGNFGTADACGVVLHRNGSDRFEVYPARPDHGCCADSQVLDSLFVNDWALFRLQIIPSGATAGTVALEGWNRYGVRVAYKTYTYTTVSGSNSNGVSIGQDCCSPADMKYGFFRIFTTNVDLNSRPPVFANTGDLLEWKFDGNLNDTNGLYNGTWLGGGSAAYLNPTLYQDFAKADIHVTGAGAATSNLRTLRTGIAAGLDGTNSFSQDNSSATISTYLWSTSACVSGSVSLSSTSSGTPTATPSAEGQCTYTLDVTDAAANTDSLSLAIGSRTMDANGVIQSANPNVAKLFGSQIGWGWNPWGYADERNMFSMTARKAVYETVDSQGFSLANPAWATPLAGTVSYIYGGTGNTRTGGTCTTISAGITATATSIAVTDATCLGLSSLPTRVTLGSGDGVEEVRICSTTGTTGAQTLTVCYDGRGVANPTFPSQALGGTAWGISTPIGQQQVLGSGTNFVGAGASPSMCPAGAGPSGQLIYSTGTATLTANSAVMTGSGTTWNSTNLHVGDIVRVAATHSSTAFTFWAYVSSIDSTTQITLSRVYPSTADTTSGLAYNIVRNDGFVSLHFARVTSGTPTDAAAAWTSTGCEDDTHLFMNYSVNGNETSYAGSTENAKSYSYGYAGYVSSSSGGANGVNFYGESFGWRKLYYRSGLTSALTAANDIDYNWVNFPVSRGAAPPYWQPLISGGGVVAAMACLVLDASCPIHWSDVRGYISSGAAIGAVVTSSTDCNLATAFDSRESGYARWWVALGAQFDEDTSMGGYREQWNTALGVWAAREAYCAKVDYSYKNSATYFNTNGPTVAVTNGSAAVTAAATVGTGYCKGTAQGTGTISSYTLTAVTGTFGAATNAVIINGSGSTQYFLVTRTDSTHLDLSALSGLAGTVNWMSMEETGGVYNGAIVFGTASSDPDLQYQYGCIRTDSSNLILDRAWEGAGTGVAKLLYRYTDGNTSGIGQQPFMQGINGQALAFAAQVDSTTFGPYRNGVSNWIMSTGIDPNTGGVNYACVFTLANCGLTANPNALYFWATPTFAYGNTTDGIKSSRAVAGEIQAMLPIYYTANRTSAAKTAADTVYGGIYGNCTYTSGGLPCDANYVTGELSDASLAGGKWPGFFFGIGGADQWPAARLAQGGTLIFNSRFSNSIIH